MFVPAASSMIISLNSTVSPNATASNSTSHDVLQVVCAWPVSGQYGPGSRILYYVLVGTCVLARKAEWLRNACLAAALLFPAVAALHGIVLAAAQRDGAVDMDLYGAFQLCSIGILAAPVTVRLSRTYFYDPGRSIIFLWTGLILAGLLSLTIGFFRATTQQCLQDGVPLSSNSTFNYDIQPQCNLTCSVPDGPFSPLRRGSANSIYVIPAPHQFTFNTATLLSAACCIPAVLSLVSMWNKVLEINWKSRFGRKEEEEEASDPIEGTNGATPKQMQKINSLVKMMRSVVEIPLFGGAVLAILILGEINFWSEPVQYQTEPMASIGQWAPVVGTALAAMGSLYLLLARDLENIEKDTSSDVSLRHCNCSRHDVHSRDSLMGSPLPTRQSPSHGDSNRIVPTMTAQSHTAHHSHLTRKSTARIPDAGRRRQVAEFSMKVGKYMGTAKEDLFDDTEFRSGKAANYPEIPGERERNPDLAKITIGYNPIRDAEGHATPYMRPRSRATSFNGSVVSGLGIDGIPIDRTSFDLPASRRSQSPSSSPTLGRHSSDDHATTSSAAAAKPLRKVTLEVPEQAHYAPMTPRGGSGSVMDTGETVVAMPERSSGPAIVVSPGTRPSSPTKELSERDGGLGG